LNIELVGVSVTSSCSCSQDSAELRSYRRWCQRSPCNLYDYISFWSYAVL